MAAGPQTITVTFTDQTAVQVASIISGVVHVQGPGGFDVPATFVSVDVNSDGTPRIATFSITPPGGNWNAGDNGVYNIVLQPGWSPMSSAMLGERNPRCL